MTVDVLAHRSIWSNTIDLLVKQGNSVGTNIIMERREMHEAIQPTMSLSHESAQELFNQLWHLGYRPLDGTGNQGHIAAIQYHLEDMRKLAFGNTI